MVKTKTISMKLTSKSRYAVTAMLDIAIHSHLSPVKLQEISKRQTISLPYLEQIFPKLRNHNIVSSFRGPGGGYRLTKPLREITIGSIVQAVDEDVDATKCLGSGNCQHGEQCLTHSLWSDLTNNIQQFLDQITLHELMERQDVQEIRQRQKNLQLESGVVPRQACTNACKK
jgi:Rrf2 family transcriptional regulator, iron-sulfur cluster assembly transcription factor